MTTQQEADGVLTRHALRELCKAHNIKTLDEQDELLVKLAQDRDALLVVVKSLSDLTRFYTKDYVEIPRHEWVDLMTEVGAARAQAEAHQ